MTITREQLADLEPGDEVEVASHHWKRAVLRGPVFRDRARFLCVGTLLLAQPDGSPLPWANDGTLTVISRVPRPLYVNHQRTEPMPGDVVRDADNPDDQQCWWCDGGHWVGNTSTAWYSRDGLPAHLRLLVDGETGQAVP